MSVRIPTARARKGLAKVVGRSARGERIKLTRYGTTLAVLIPKRDLEALEACEQTGIHPSIMLVPRKPVLVVDDDPALRDALREHLETEGYSVVEAANGLAALQRLRGGLRPRAIVLDLMMPVMDGWDFRTGQLSDPDLKGIPVVLITAAGFSKSSIRTQFGEIEMLPKPLIPSDILATLRKLDGSSEPAEG